MQIPPTSAAVQAAGGTVAQASKEHATVAADAPAPNAAHVEQSGTSDPDRDAQGQGDGLNRPKGKPKTEDVLELSDAPESTTSGHSHLPDENSDGLDLMV